MSPPSAREFARHLASFAPDPTDPTKPANRPALAALRRGLGKKPDENLEPYRYIGTTLARCAPWQIDWYYLVACLFALHPVNWPEWGTGDGFMPTNLGASFHRLVADTENMRESAEKRFVALLNCHVDDLPQHLRQAVSLLKAHNVQIDWARLLDDVQKWDHQEGHVRRDWAQAFWSDPDRPDNDQTAGPDAGTNDEPDSGSKS